ncbi:MAG: carboxypeptidase-like regulatory domain-containing protein, partial [Vicinamibacterales bacterium]
APASLDLTRTFAFTISADAIPGSSVAINATGVDTKGQTTNAVPVVVTVLDATPPVVTITGTTTGAKVSPGQQTSAIVSAQDLGQIASLSFTTGGVLSGTQTRVVDPAQPSVVTAFAFTVPASAHAGDILTLDATATDKAGNVASAARVLLPIADLNGPALQLRTTTGNTEIVPGAVVTVLAVAEDETGVETIALTGQGAFGVSQAKQVSPVSNSVQLPFPISVPANAVEGAVLTLSATATDIFGNVSGPATLVLTVRSSVSVTLPPSLLLAAGDAVPIDVQLSAPAPAGGLRVDLVSADAATVQVATPLQFAEGEATKSAIVTGIRGGTVSLTAAVNGVQRASMTVAVRGGIVSGTVLNPQLQPVAGAHVTVTSNGFVTSTVSDAAGTFLVEGVGQFFSVKVSDPVTNLIGFATGSMNVANGFAHINVIVITAGSISGTVLGADGHTATGAGARVDIFASNNPSTSLGITFTDADGAYEFPIVSPGSYLVEASDVTGNRARSAPLVIVNSGQHVDGPLSYLGRGTLTGVVRDGIGNAVGNVPIQLTSRSLFGQAPVLSVNAAQDGTFRFDGVFVGTFTLQARDPITNLVGTVSGAIDANLQVVPLDVRLAQWGGLQGTVFRSDGVTPVANADVSISAAGSQSTTTDAQGHYAVQFLPLGLYSVSVREPSTRGIGYATGTLSVYTQVTTQNVTLFPQGTLVVTVTDANGVPVPGALVRITTNNNLAGDSFETTTGPNGAVVVEHVLASQYVTVQGLANGLSGYVQTTLQAAEVKPVPVTLQPTGSITGTVFRPDGQTPAADARVNVFGTLQQVGPDGTFRFDNLSLRNWDVVAYDAQGRKRAQTTNVLVNQNGQVVTVNLTFVGLGSVVGRVLNPDNSSASNLTALVHALDPTFGSFAAPQTDGAGFYRADNVVVGPVTVNVGDPGRGLLGEANGVLGRDGDTLTLDILLKNNAIALPVTKTDANFFTFDVQKNGSIASGQNGVFGGAFSGGTFLLDVVASGTPNRFTGGTFGTTEDGGREVVVTQAGLAGLNVTRKVLISPTYFARYLEILTNPTAAPVTVDVRVLNKSGAVSVQATSSGDATLDVSSALDPDRWVTLNMGQDLDPFVSFVYPQLGFGFDGVGAPSRVSSAVVSTEPSTGLRVLTYGWDGVTIPAGQTVAFMHFGVQQYSRAAAQASVDRLVQLPPEALESLSPAEISQIQNFVVPADATSPIAPLPPLGGSISGRVLAADQTTPISSLSSGGGFFVNVRYRSNTIFFGRLYQGSANATGNFTFGGTTATVPLAPFTLDATHPVTSLVSPSTAGSFSAGTTASTVNIVFANSGLVNGVVRRTSGVPVAGATPIITTTSLNASFPVTGSDGSYVTTGVPPGAVTVTLRHPQGFSNTFPFTFSLKGKATLTLAAGATETRDLTIQPTGTVTGTVQTGLGAPAISLTVKATGIDPNDPLAYLQTQTDSSGTYRFNDAPLGLLTVTATDPATFVQSSTTATVVQDQTSIANLTLSAVGSIDLTVTYTNGLPAAGAFVEIQKAALDQFFRSVGSTNASGRLSIPNVPGGAFVVRLHRPDNSNITVDVPGSLTAQGQVVPVTAMLPPVGTLRVTVTSLTGTPVQNSLVYADIFSPDSFSTLGTTDANGVVTYANLLGGRTLRVRAYDGSSQFGQFRESPANLQIEGQTLAVSVVLGTTGEVAGRVTNANGSPAAAITVLVLALEGTTGLTAQTDSDGHYRIADVPLGRLRARVQDSSGRFGSVEGTLTSQGQHFVADIVLSKLTLPQTLQDANGSAYVVRTDGSLISSTGLDGFSGYPGMTVGPSGGGQFSFQGDVAAATNLDGRELVVPNFGSQNLALKPIAGLNVSRKVYVDSTGYFARYLEIFDNPTSAPISVDVTLQGTLNATRYTTTSSGDATLTAADQWLLADYATSPTVANGVVVFQGVGAPISVSSATNVTSGFSPPIAPAIRWNNVEVPAGGRTILMHFVSSESGQAAARAAAERLVQAPAEALVGLTAADFAAIRNFAIPPDGSSTAAPFATVTGRVLAGGSAPVPNAQVTVSGSSTPIYKPTLTVKSDALGQYKAATLDVGPFSVQAKDPVSGVLTALASLSVEPGQTTITQDLSFADAGVVRGTVRFGTGAAVPNGQVTISGGSPAVNLVVQIAADGTYAATVAPGTYTVTASSAGRVRSRADNVVT